MKRVRHCVSYHQTEAVTVFHTFIPRNRVFRYVLYIPTSRVCHCVSNLEQSISLYFIPTMLQQSLSLCFIATNRVCHCVSYQQTNLSLCYILTCRVCHYVSCQRAVFVSLGASASVWAIYLDCCDAWLVVWGSILYSVQYTV